MFFSPLLKKAFLGFISISISGKFPSYILLKIFKSVSERLYSVELKQSQFILLIWSMKEAWLFLLKICFLISSGEEFCGDFKVLTESKMGKWCESSDFIIMPFFKDSLKIFLMMTLSIIVADILTTQVGLFIKTIRPYSKSELQNVFVLTFWACRKNSLIRKIRLISKFVTSQPG